MRMLRALLAPIALAVLTLPLAFGAASADTAAPLKITVGKIVGGDGFHIPSYIAMDQGFYKAEGLDARFIELNGKALVTAALAGNIDFVPIPSGGSQAALLGAPIRYVVGESLKSQWEIIVPKSINKPEDLKGKILGYGRPGSADYDEGAEVLERFFHMKVGRDYKVISFQGEPERIAALINGDIQGALVSAPNAARGEEAGLKVLLRTGNYLPRVGGVFWTTKGFLDKNQEATKRFIRAIARGVMYFRDHKKGSVKTIMGSLGIKDEKTASLIWDQLHDSFGAEVPKPLFRALFEDRRQTMIANHLWAADKPLPDPEQFIARKLLETTLQQMHYVPTKIDVTTK